MASKIFKKRMPGGLNEGKVRRMIAEAVEFGYICVSGERKTATYHLLISNE